MLRGVTATSPSITWWLLFPKWDRCPKVGHSVVSLFLLCFIAYLYEANGGTDMGVLACFRPCFSFWTRLVEPFSGTWAQSGTQRITLLKCVRVRQECSGVLPLRLPQLLGDCCFQNGTDVLKWDIPRMSYFLSFAVILSSLCNWNRAQSYKKLPEAIVPKVGHGPKIGQYGFDRAWFSVVFLFLLCFIADLYEANGGTDIEVLACFRPDFLIPLYPVH